MSSEFQEFQKLQEKKDTVSFSDASSLGSPLIKCHLPNGIVVGHMTKHRSEHGGFMASFTKEGKKPVYGNVEYCIKALEKRAKVMRVKYAIKGSMKWLIPMIVGALITAIVRKFFW